MEFFENVPQESVGDETLLEEVDDDLSGGKKSPEEAEEDDPDLV